VSGLPSDLDERLRSSCPGADRFLNLRADPAQSPSLQDPTQSSPSSLIELRSPILIVLSGGAGKCVTGRFFIYRLSPTSAGLE